MVLGHFSGVNSFLNLQGCIGFAEFFDDFISRFKRCCNECSFFWGEGSTSHLQGRKTLWFHQPCLSDLSVSGTGTQMILLSIREKSVFWSLKKNSQPKQRTWLGILNYNLTQGSDTFCRAVSWDILTILNVCFHLTFN